ncbi:MAG: acetate--CoA ligase family protein [Thermovirgaceae bacterium]|nr:acetate--CoA ligase family protein [Thermovirgaceae bacterium]
MNRLAAKVTDISRLLSPRSVAVVGASGNPESISGRPVKLLQRFGFKGRIFPVNPGRERIADLECFPDIASLPETPDVVLVGVRAGLVPGVISQCADRRVPYSVIFSSGFAESDESDAQREIMDTARRGGVRILGPNCQGLVNFAGSVPLSFSASLDSDSRPLGNVAYVSQSGAFGFASFAMAAESGVGFKYVVTTGNQADLDIVDFGTAFASDPEVRLLVFYMEGLSDGPRFIEMLRFAGERNVPVAILKVGKSPTGRTAAKSHTAALTGEDEAWRTVFRQYGVIEIEDAEDIADLGKVFGRDRRSSGKKLGIITTSGGAGIIMADRSWDLGLEVAPLPQDVQVSLERFVPSFGSTANPVDLTAQVINDPEGFRSCLDTVLDCPEVDMVAVVLSMITGDSGAVVTRDLIEAARLSEKPMACCWLINREQGGPFLDELITKGVPLFRSLKRCAWALAQLARWMERPALPARAPDNPGEPFLPGMPPDLTEYDAKRLLERWGVPVSHEILTTSLEGAIAAAEEIGYPVALKIVSPEILHKTDVGAVALRLKDKEELRNAYGRLLERSSKAVPQARIRGVLIQEMVSDGMECMIGVKRDPLFGPLVAVGLGGIYVEILNDVSIRQAPVDRDEAVRMIRDLRGFPLLAGTRGKPPRDVDALADMVSKISVMACAEDTLGELDVNPVFVLDEGNGAVVVDAVVIRRSDL